MGDSIEEFFSRIELDDKRDKTVVSSLLREIGFKTRPSFDKTRFNIEEIEALVAELNSIE